MNFEKFLRTGDEIRVKSEHVSILSTIEKIIGEDILAIHSPLNTDGQPVVQSGVKYLVSCVTDQGIYMFEALSLETRHSQNAAHVELKALSDYKKIQRRDAFRAKEHIDVSIRKITQVDAYAEKWISTHTVDISETGMLLRYHEDCAVGQLIDCVVRIDNFGIKEIMPKLKGRVTRCSATGSKENPYFLGVSFVDLPDKARDLIIKFVVLSQRSKLTYKNTKRYK